MLPGWTPQSWRDYPASQQPIYEEPETVEEVVGRIRLSPGIVCSESVFRLKKRLELLFKSPSDVLLQAGDCAETFSSCEQARVTRDAELVTSLSPALSIGRICGQFAKPRSHHVEIHKERGEIPVFRGDIINGYSPLERSVNPNRMQLAHSLSLNMYRQLQDIGHDFFISHECLLLPYEEALIKCDKGQRSFSSSAHFLWIGDRTRELNGAHIEFCRGLENPIGIKVGPSSDPREIRECVVRLDPTNSPGKITIITRFGVGGAARHLPALIRELRGLNVLYQCDPMHGNTVILSSGKKTRYVESIKHEIMEVVEIHRTMGSRVHGLHLETTGTDVTECMGVNVHDVNLPNYQSLCDPRLNPIQARHVVEFFCEKLKQPKPFICLSRLSTAETSRSDNSTTSSDEEKSFDALRDVS
jgi:3-deoxy-7-phosphoheptulonate synthase